METSELLREVRKDLDNRKNEGQIAAFSVIEEPRPVVQIRTVGKNVDRRWISQLEEVLHQRSPHITFEDKHQNITYYLLAQEPLPQEARPGSGIVRVAGGVPEGPAGTLTCFLASQDGRDFYFAAAGHVVSDFWRLPENDPKGSIYHNPKGFPATNSTRFLGKLRFLKDRPCELNQPVEGKVSDSDIGIISLKGDFEWKQRTTCYGTFGEWPKKRPGKPKEGKIVMKCGSEEPHWTYAVVEEEYANVMVYGPSDSSCNYSVFELRGQVILRQINSPAEVMVFEDDAAKAEHLYRHPKTSFAIPGDSGTMVVDYKTRQPLGMLIAGSLLDGKYVMTPIRALWDYWTGKQLVLLRA